VSIKAAGKAKRFGFVGLKALTQLSRRVLVESFTLLALFVELHLDGLHPGPRGYALIANALVLNKCKYSSTLKANDLVFILFYPKDSINSSIN
jgi:hypothetical protein